MLKVVELRAERESQSRHNRNQFLHRERNANDAGGRREDFLGPALEDFRRGRTGGSSCRQSRFARGTIGIAGVNRNQPHTACGCTQIFLVDNQRSGYYAVGSKGRGCACRRVCSDEGKVGAAALLEARLGGPEAKAARNEELGCIGHGG